MQMELSANFAELKKRFLAGEIGRLKEFAAERACQALEFSDVRLAQFAVVAYSLAKLIEKSYIYQTPRWKKFTKFFIEHLSKGEDCEGDAGACTNVLMEIMREMNVLSSDLGRFVMSAVEKAKIKTATQIYAHGASIGRAIELTGADRKELLSYIGATRLPEKYETKSVGHRLAFAEKLFR